MSAVECMSKEDLQGNVQYEPCHRYDGQLSAFYHGCHWYQNDVIVKKYNGKID